MKWWSFYLVDRSLQRCFKPRLYQTRKSWFCVQVCAMKNRRQHSVFLFVNDRSKPLTCHVLTQSLWIFWPARYHGLILSLPECLIEFCKVTLTFESVDEILWCDYSNESSLPVLSHDAICFSKLKKNEIWKFGRNLPLATFGSERVKWAKSVILELKPYILLKKRSENSAQYITHSSLPSLPLCSAISWSFVSALKSWPQNCRKSQILRLPKPSLLKQEFQARYVIMGNYILGFNFVCKL